MDVPDMDAVMAAMQNEAMAGKRLFEGFSQSMDLDHRGVRQSPFGTFIKYRVKR